MRSQDGRQGQLTSGLVAVRLLDTTGRRGGLASSLGGELLTGGLATSRLACVVLSAMLRSDTLFGDEATVAKRGGRATATPATSDEATAAPVRRLQCDAQADKKLRGSDLRAVCLVRAIVDDGLDDARCCGAELWSGGGVDGCDEKKGERAGGTYMGGGGGAAAWINSSCFGASEGQLRSWKASVCRSQN
jgi:hypothetical protein